MGIDEAERPMRDTGTFRNGDGVLIRGGTHTNAVGGFTLIEALVALAVAAVCLGAIGALMTTTIRGVRKIDQRLALVSTLRKVVAALPDRNNLTADSSGEMAGADWSIKVAPYPDPTPPSKSTSKAPPAWTPETIDLSVRAASGSRVSVKTIRLVPVQQ